MPVCVCVWGALWPFLWPNYLGSPLTATVFSQKLPWNEVAMYLVLIQRGQMTLERFILCMGEGIIPKGLWGQLSANSWWGHVLFSFLFQLCYVFTGFKIKSCRTLNSQENFGQGTFQKWTGPSMGLDSLT